MRRLPFFLLLPVLAAAAPWPIPPLDSVHPLGNNWGEYQDYGSGPYFHNGIDIITPGISGSPVHAVRHGWVKAWGTIQWDLHYRLAICDTSSDFTGRAGGWLYAHIDPARWHKQLGDEVQERELIGYLVEWPVTGFDHCHFARISDTGAAWQRFPDPTWWFTDNPLLLLQPRADLAAPVFQDARTSRRFAFCRNNTTSYLNAESLYGSVDIIAKCYDKTGYSTTDSTWDKLVPYQLDYMVRSAGGTVVVPWTLSFQFSNLLGGLNDSLQALVVFKRDATCRTRGDYDYREYYFIVTNTDGDSLIELGDAAGCWQTDGTVDGDYWVMVRASDVAGNSTLDSMLVQTRNGVTGLAGPALPVLSRPLVVAPAITRGEFSAGFGLAAAAPVELRVVDAAGRVVARPAGSLLGAGEHRFTAAITAPGVYLVQLRLGGGVTATRKLVVVN
jgi:hypothetical protein